MSKFVVKTKSIALIAVIVAVVLVVMIVPGKPEGGDSGIIPPQAIDEPQLQEDVLVDTEVVEEIVLIKNDNGADCWIDENGTKHYVLDAIDAPILGE